MKENDMSLLKSKIITLSALAVFTFSAVGCGYILYPERRTAGARGGQLDVTVLVMDILWLIPGILPGVFALVWDGIHGSWYVSGGRPLMMRNDTRGPSPQLARRPVTLRGIAAGTALRLDDATGRTHRLTAEADVRGGVTVRVPAAVPAGRASLHFSSDGRAWRTIPVEIR
jgi:hypothetical protein